MKKLADNGNKQRHLLQQARQFFADKEARTRGFPFGFHVVFGRIHPFQNGNSRVGRLVMFKECLASCVVPFVIADDMKAFYYAAPGTGL